MADENENLALSSEHLLNEVRVLRIAPSLNVITNKMRMHNNIMRIATWNIRSLFMGGKLANVEMNKLNIDILKLGEVTWPPDLKNRKLVSRGTIYYSGGSNSIHRYGIAIMVTEEMAKSVTKLISLNDGLILMKIQTSHGTTNIIQLYSSTNDNTEAEVEEFYNSVGKVTQLIKKRVITMTIILKLAVELKIALWENMD